MSSDSDKIHDFAKSKWKKFKIEYKSCKEGLSVEHVHDIRVALRRLMALDEILGPIFGISDKKIKNHCAFIKKNIKIFGPLRDVHISIAHIESLQDDFPCSSAFADHLLFLEKKLSKRLSKELESVDYPQIKAISNSLLKHISSGKGNLSLYPELCQSSKSAFGDVMSTLSSASSDDMKSLHRVRIAFKRFRYMMEVIDRIKPVGSSSHDAMQQLQDSFGYIQDISVIEGLMSSFLKKHPYESGIIEEMHEELLKRQRNAAALLLSSKDILDSLNPALLFS